MISASSFKLHIVNYTDTHGRYLSRNSQGTSYNPYGLDRLSSFLKELRKKEEPVLVIENGDSIQGKPIVDMHDFNSPICEDLEHPLNLLHQKLGVQCFVVGNHEFNFGLNHLEKIRKNSKIPWLGANIVSEKTEDCFFEPYSIFKYEDHTVGVIGLVTETIPKWENRSHISKLKFVDVIEVATTHIKKIRKECDFIIVVLHGGLESNPETGDPWSFGNDKENRGLELLQSVSGIDLLLTGHQHRTLLFPSDELGPKFIVQPPCYAKGWAHLTLEMKKTGEHLLNASLINAANWEPDPELEEILTPHIKIINKVLDTELGFAPPEFAITDPMSQVWLQKHPLVQWINNLMCKATGVDVAASCILSNKTPGLSGKVTIGDVFQNYYFQDTICVIKIDGKTLRAILEKAASFFQVNQNQKGEKLIEIHPDWRRFKILAYNYDIWDGISYGINPEQAIGSRISWLTYKGENLLDETEIYAAVTNYRAGGAFYSMLSSDNIVQEFPVKITDLMTHDLLEQKTLDVEVIQNFKIILD